MALTKTTHRKRESNKPKKEQKCPMCPFRTADSEVMRDHLVQCGLRKMEKALKCNECEYVTDKSGNLSRHQIRRHSMTQAVTQENGA